MATALVQFEYKMEVHVPSAQDRSQVVDTAVAEFKERFPDINASNFDVTILYIV